MASIIVAADGGGKVVEVSQTAAASSEVLRRLPHRDASEPPIKVPFSAAHVRDWAAGAPELLISFEESLAVLKVCLRCFALTPSAWDCAHQICFVCMFAY